MIGLNRTLIVLILPLLCACGNDIAPGRTTGEPDPVKGLGIARLNSEAFPAAQLLTGTVESRERAVLAARIDGRVERFHVKAGDQVAGGALLVTIADTPTGARLAEAESAHRTAAARLALAEQTLARFDKLKAGDAVTPQEYDRVASEAAQARGAVRAAEAQISQARTVAGYARVTAPFPGRVAGTAVEAGATVMPGTPLLTLDRTGGWQARLTAPESLAGEIRAGSIVQIEVPTLGKTFTATVSEVEPAADPVSRAFRIKADLPEDPHLTAGLFARGIHGGATSDTLLLPASALVTRGQLTGVYVVEDGRLRWRLVRTGRAVGERLEVLSGLVAGEQVVVSGAGKAVNGARLEN